MYIYYYIYNCVSKEYGILNKNGAGAMTTAKNAVFIWL